MPDRPQQLSYPAGGGEPWTDQDREDDRAEHRQRESERDQHARQRGELPVEPEAAQHRADSQHHRDSAEVEAVVDDQDPQGAGDGDPPPPVQPPQPQRLPGPDRHRVVQQLGARVDPEGLPVADAGQAPQQQHPAAGAHELGQQRQRQQAEDRLQGPRMKVVDEGARRNAPEEEHDHSRPQRRVEPGAEPLVAERAPPKPTSENEPVATPQRYQSQGNGAG